MVGIDPGARTGFAVWDAAARKFTRIATLRAWAAMYEVQAMYRAETLHMVIMEDARLRLWFGRAGREVLQGAGAIKRECALWAEMLGDLGIPSLQVKPQAGATKWSAAQFERVTGWQGRTSEHARDAALLVWQRRCVMSGVAT